MTDRSIATGLRMGAAWLAACAPLGCGSDDSAREAASGSTSASKPSFVGSAACVACHADAAASWERSQHRAAMAFATTGSVKAPFGGEELREGGGAVTFGREGGGYRVSRDRAARGRVDPDAKADDGVLRISGTFGVDPLQQYLLEAVDGRVQVLPWAWDTRPESAGGQRWFNLYPEATLDATDPLHFSRPSQNWNHVCADCHVTGFRKRFDAQRAQFESRWEELGVGCESCHGPGAEHIRWATSRTGDAASGSPQPQRASRDGSEMGLVAHLDERRGIRWTIDPTSGNPLRSAPRTTSRELDVCAPCHARRSNITESHVAGEPFLDHHRPSLLDPGLYFADGQQDDEVFSWGSFLQSRMHAKGVTCSDCHDPHSGKPRAEGNALCASCHAPSKYATPDHHRHAPASSGSQCVACHMPTKTYMMIDPRHDHSLRVPRPDQTVSLGVPNACQSCHAERPVRWADETLRRWRGRPAQGFERHAAAFHASEIGAPEAGPALRAVAADSSQPSIVRAAALARLDGSLGRSSAEALVRAVGDPDALVRLGALEGLASAPGEARISVAEEALRDPLRALRFEAVRMLTAFARELSPAVRAVYEQEAAEYEASLRRDADRAEARTQLGVFLAERGDAEGARRELAVAISIEPRYEPAHINLADLERALGLEAEAIRTLDAALARMPESAALHHARGLARVRAGRMSQAEADLARAVDLDPDSIRFAYVHAVALHSAGKVREAIERLEATAAAHPGDRAVREALVSFHSDAGNAAAAARHHAALARLEATNP